MFRHIILTLFIIGNITACSSTVYEEVASSSKKNNTHQVSTPLNKSTDISNKKKIASYPFYALGTVMMGGGVIIAALDKDEPDEDSQNGIIALGLIVSGALVWHLGNVINNN